MKKLALTALSLAVVAGSAFVADPAFARRGWQDQDAGAHHQAPWHDNGHHYGWRNDNNWHFRDHDRVVVREYYNAHPGRWNRPQHARYVVGQPLARTVVYRPVPQPVLMQLAPPPPHYRYVQVDGDVLLMSDITRVIADAIALN